MRRVALALFSTITGLVLLLGFKTHSPATSGLPAAIGTSEPATTGTGTTTTPTGTGSSSSASSNSTSSSSTSATKTVTGDSVDTRWGPVQVRITVTNGKITSVTAVDYPTGNPKDQEINAYAIPTLNKETLAAGSAQIDTISGATVTSDGYISSLQSALDKAGL
jgi:uncharacterized protein with FMN-binding domain